MAQGKLIHLFETRWLFMKGKTDAESRKKTEKGAQILFLKVVVVINKILQAFY